MARNYKKGIEVLKIYIVDRACVQEEALNRRRRRRRRQRGNLLHDHEVKTAYIILRYVEEVNTDTVL